MAVSFNILPDKTQVFTSPFVSVTAVDTTPGISGVSAWEWKFNKTTVSVASSWVYKFFDPVTANLVLNVSGVPFGTAISDPVTITIQDAYPTILSFKVIPDTEITIGPKDKSIAITALDTSPSVSGVTGWRWTFNGAPVSKTNKWEYTFFDPITGNIQLDVTGTTFSGTQTIGPQTLKITAPNVNACDKHPVLPKHHKGSTTLSHKITSYDLLVNRIKYQLGWPAVQIEICDETIYDFVDQSVEWYSKYAGQTEEYLAFDAAKVHECGLGIKLDTIFSNLYKWYCDPCDSNRNNPAISAQFYDCDLNMYRKVVDVFSVDPAEFTGTDVLFTMDYLFAQQTYFSYLLGSFGWDLITWHILKDWLDLRSKLFATKPYVRFDPRTQYLKLMPEPRARNNFIGVIGCRVERPVCDIVQERWTQRYALALTKIALAHIRGKFGQVTLFGGSVLNSTDLMTQGTEEKKQLEDELMSQFGEVTPPLFFIG